MKNSATYPTLEDCLPCLSSESQGWENIIVEKFQHQKGEGNCSYSSEHTICLSLAPRPVRLMQIQGGKTYTGLYGKGDISITPAKVPFFARQEGILGDGNLCIFDVYEASIIWDGQTRIIEVDEAQTEPLVGISLIEGYQLQIQGIVGGLVTITALS